MSNWLGESIACMSPNCPRQAEDYVVDSKGREIALCGWHKVMHVINKNMERK